MRVCFWVVATLLILSHYLVLTSADEGVLNSQTNGALKDQVLQKKLFLTHHKLSNHTRKFIPRPRTRKRGIPIGKGARKSSAINTPTYRFHYALILCTSLFFGPFII
ncbi:unnamed protein product [Lupinus luteus]|uniref:Uncharacterized protein n=1 Tax=Lupinus luteus TaxID=3873 RepID=A0AAV1WDN7_LUPLU